MRYKGEPQHSCYTINEVADKLGEAQSDLEEVRTINEELRSWGRDGWDEVEECKSTISDLEKTIDKLEYTIQ